MDLTAKLSELNCELQGKDRDLSHRIGAVNAFKAKVSLWTSQLWSKRLIHFPNLGKVEQSIREKGVFRPEHFCVHLDKLAVQFEPHFQELKWNGGDCCPHLGPFSPVDIEKLSDEFQQTFSLPNELGMEMITLQSDIELKARSQEVDFGGLVRRETYLHLSLCMLRVKVYHRSL